MFNETLDAVLVDRAGTCPIQGNPDLYGLGIRLGIYFQMITVQISAMMSQALRDDDYLGEATIVFIISVGSVLVSEIYKGKEGIQAVEAAPILALLIAQVGSCRIVATRSIIPTVIYSVELCGLIGLNVWYWWYGMDTLGRACPDDKAFFFAKVSLWGWFRTLNKVFTVFSAICGVLAAVIYMTSFGFYGFVKVRNLFKGRHQSQPEQQVQQVDDRDRFTPGDFGKMELVLNISVIVYVEMTLRWNNISGVNSLRSPGQFMPFFIAVAQFFGVLYQAISRGLSLIAADDDAWDDDYEVDCKHDSKFLFRPDGAKSSAHDIELAPDSNASVMRK